MFIFILVHCILNHHVDAHLKHLLVQLHLLQIKLLLLQLDVIKKLQLICKNTRLCNRPAKKGSPPWLHF